MVRNKFKVILAGEELGVFDETQITLDDAFALEGNAGQTINQMLAGLAPMQATALRSLVWFMRYKAGAAVPKESINFILTDLSYEAIPDPPKARAKGSVKSGTSTSDSSPTSAT